MTVDNITSLSPKITYKFIAKLYIDPQLNGIILFQCLLFILVILGKPYQIATNICAYKTLLQLRIQIDDFPSFVATKTAYRLKPFAKENILWNISLSLVKHLPATQTYMSLNPSSPDLPDGLGINIHATCFLDKASCSIEVNVGVKQKAQTMNTLLLPFRPLRLAKENDSCQMSACGFLKTEVFIVSSVLVCYLHSVRFFCLLF